MKKILGRISGNDLNEITFVCDSENEQGEAVPVELGEILVIDDEKTNEMFIVRVTNIAFGQKPEWMKEVARSYNRFQTNALRDQHEKPEERYQMNRKEQLFLMPRCELLGYIAKNGSFLTPKKLPSYFSAVRKPDEEDFRFLEDYLGDIALGNVRSGSSTIPVGAGLFGDLLPKHIGVFAQTGGGKSNAMQVLVGSVMEQEGKYGLLLFEPHGEYIKNLARHPMQREQLVAFSASGKTGRQLRIFHGEVTVSAVMNLRQQLNITEPQERVMAAAYSAVGKQWFHVLTSYEVTEEDAMNAGLPHTMSLEGVLRINDKNPLWNAMLTIRSKLERLSRASYFTDNQSQCDVDDIMSQLDNGKVVLIDLSTLSGMNELLLSTVLSNKLLNRRMGLYAENHEKFEDLPPVSIVMEEAQRVLAKGETGHGNVFADICAQGRKFKTGLIAITQQPKVMDPIVLSQFNTFIILSISDETDFDILAGRSKKPIQKLQSEIRSLMPGEAIITSPKSPFAMPIKVFLYEDYIQDIKKKKKETKLKKESFKGMV